jgi:SAM-dependent methyltransferase
MLDGKPAGVRCVQLSADNRCLLYGDLRRPAVCIRFRASPETCGSSREEAMRLLAEMELETAPQRAKDEGRMTDRAGGYQENPFVAELYDHLYRQREDVSFWREAAEASGGPVLEIGCGTGRVLIPIARAGIEITGLDLSEHMLRVCGERLAQEPDEVQARAHLVQADMRDFDLGQCYRLVTTPYRPFQHLETVQDQLSCLRCVRRHLAPGGRLILDLFNPSVGFLASEVTGEETGDEAELVLPDGQRVRRGSRIVSKDLHRQVFRAEQIFYVTHLDGRQERLVHAYAMRYLFRYEAEHLLARCGFALEHVYAGFDRRPYGSEYPGELIVVARPSAPSEWR